jgi:undecaprenyl-diphosphatase
MSFFDAIIFGIVEGLSEFLPISSTGHLILTAKLLRIPQTDFVKSFEIAIQLGAICSVVFLYFKSLLLDGQVIRRLIVAFVPTGVIGFGLYKIIKGVLLGNAYVVLWSLLTGGILLVVFEWRYREKEGAVADIRKISYKQAALIGTFQALAVIPGVSRAAATILGGLWLGLKRKTIVEFSFLLAVPTMLAATVLDLAKSAGQFSSDQLAYLLVGFGVAFVVAIAAIKSFLGFIQRYNFIAFGVYRILLALFFFWFR